MNHPAAQTPRQSELGRDDAFVARSWQMRKVPAWAFEWGIDDWVEALHEAHDASARPQLPVVHGERTPQLAR